MILYAPNVHTGGGLSLLRELLSAWPADKPLLAFCDKRAKNSLLLPEAVEVTWVAPKILARLQAEFLLYRESKKGTRTIFCFHGLPPLFPFPGRVVVFVQNRILVEQGYLIDYPLLTRVRITMERFWLRATKGHATRYIVQTPSMLTSLRALLGHGVEICALSFVSSNLFMPYESNKYIERKFDFVYVASGDSHKNHSKLLEAWLLLNETGLNPSLALTVEAESHALVFAEISKVTRDSSLNIVNHGQLSARDVAELYQSSSALIYPSKTESFGLPLLEASYYKLPILASELDYVRDVIVPTETFDPNSPVSIARAVRRFLGRSEATVEIHSAKDFLAEVLR